MENTGIMPVMDINRGNGYGDGFGWGGGCAWFMWVIVIFALLGWNRNGNGNGLDAAATFANGAITRNEIANGFDYQTLENGIRGIQNGLCDGFYAMNTTALQGMAGLEKTIMQGDFALQTAVNASSSALGGALAENRFAQQQCCCETNRNIDAVRADAYKNTCEITNAIHGEGEKTRALITANTMQDLRDRLEERDRQLQSANFQLSQVAQTSLLTNTLRPFPQPAYITASPYTGASTIYGYGCGCAGGVA